MSDNWIVQNLNSALNTWNEKLAEIWTLLTQSPESFKGGDIWSVITGINGALTAIGYGLLVLFFAAGIVKTCGSFTDMKKPEHALKAFIRFALAQGAIMYGMELMTALFSIVQGIVSTIMAQSGMANGGVTELPAEIVEKIEAVGMLESIPLWIVTLLGSLLITVLSFIMILTVYGRMFRLYMYTAIAPRAIPAKNISLLSFLDCRGIGVLPKVRLDIQTLCLQNQFHRFPSTPPRRIDYDSFSLILINPSNVVQMICNRSAVLISVFMVPVTSFPQTTTIRHRFKIKWDIRLYAC